MQVDVSVYQQQCGSSYIDTTTNTGVFPWFFSHVWPHVPSFHPSFKGSAAQQQQQQWTDDRQRGDPDPQHRAVGCLGPALTFSAAAGAPRKCRHWTPGKMLGNCWENAWKMHGMRLSTVSRVTIRPSDSHVCAKDPAYFGVMNTGWNLANWRVKPTSLWPAICCQKKNNFKCSNIQSTVTFRVGASCFHTSAVVNTILGPIGSIG